MPWLWVAALLVCASCKQKSKEETEPTPVASASAAPAETPAATPAPPDTIPPPTQPPTAAAAATGGGAKAESIKACCAALHKEEANATGAQKSTYTNSANSCDAISKLVSTGVTKKAAALTQLRASLKGAALPAGCN
jgi:hypothetical protein